MTYRPYPNADRALERVDPAAANDDHDFRYDDDAQRCTRCRLPHAHWSGGPCPRSPQNWGPGRYI